MTGTFEQPDFEAQGGTEYKTNIDNCIEVLKRSGGSFAPHEQDTPNMTVALDAGFIWDGEALTEVNTQNTSTFTAPNTYSRIDRILVDAITGVVSVATGTESGSPSPPSIPSGKLPVARVTLATTTTAITNNLITDERTYITSIDPVVESFPVNGVYENRGTNPATELGFGTWEYRGVQISDIQMCCHYNTATVTKIDIKKGSINVSSSNVSRSTTTKKFGASSIYFSAYNSYLIYSTVSGGHIDFWLYISSLSSYIRSILYFAEEVYLGADSTPRWKLGSNYINDSIQTGTWMHIALVDQVGFFVNGNLKSTAVSISALSGLGYVSGVADCLIMYIDELVVRNSPTYLSSFASAIPTTAYITSHQWLRTV